MEINFNELMEEMENFPSDKVANIDCPNSKYWRWIDLNYNTREKYYLKCKEATEAMNRIFPKLTKVKGHYIDLFGTKHPHWWLKTEEGDVIDPTIRQFIDFGMGEYVEHVGEEPKGKCLNCGEYSYYTANFCSEKCNLEFLKSLTEETNK